jgi:nucleotidyltransferase substrate binding protein (TIGR01987 family)
MKENLIEYSLEKLKNAFDKLAGGAKIAEDADDDLYKDGVIQRFEFTFELLWKTIKIYLENQGIIVRSPRESFKEAFRLNLIKDEKLFLDMLKDRNDTTHIYDKETAEGIFNRIKSNYIPAIKQVLKKIS